MKEYSYPIVGKEKIAAIVPHKGDMLLLDAITRLTEGGIEARATIESSSPFFFAGKAPAYVCFELIAQCISAYSKIMDYSGGDEPSIGFILKVSDFVCSRPYLEEGEEAIITIRQEAVLPSGLFSFFGDVVAGSETVASGHLLVMSADDAEIQKMIGAQK